MTNASEMPERCIERHGFTGQIERHSVFEHGAEMRGAEASATRRHVRLPRGDLDRGRSKVEELTAEWQKTRQGEFRISDWDFYDTQMRQLIGLEPTPEGAGLDF